MNFKDITGQNFSDDAEFDDIDDFDYVDGFIREEDDDDDYDIEEEFDDLDDLYMDDDDEDDDDDLDDNLQVAENDVPATLVCEECAHQWNDLISEEENEGELQRTCPMCGSRDISLGG